jgi:hypothetical protein
MSLIKLFLGGNNLVLSRTERVWSVTSRLGTGKWLTLFYSVYILVPEARGPAREITVATAGVVAASTAVVAASSAAVAATSVEPTAGLHKIIVFFEAVYVPSFSPKIGWGRLGHKRFYLRRYVFSNLILYYLK